MNQTTYNSLKAFIWGIANDCLVDVYDVGDYRKVILPFFVIRRFDAVLAPKHDDVVKKKKEFEAKGITVDIDPALCTIACQAFCNRSEYTLTDLKARTNQQQLKRDFLDYLDGFSQNVQEILNKFKIRNEIETLSQHDRLGLLIEKFVDPRYNFSTEPVLNDDGTVLIEGLDNHSMGTLFEDVIRQFNEETNITDAGRHFTPRDIVELMADLAFIPVQDQIQSTTYRIYDGACGTGGMLTVGESHIQTLATRRGKRVSIKLFGQENADETYAIARADMLVKGEGAQANNIRYGSTISDDRFSRDEFDFMLSNPPFGTSWKSELKAWGDIKKTDITDPRFIVEYADTPEFSLVPDIGDPQMLFLANNISKMKKSTPLGSRIVEVHNSASLSTGKAGSGPSNLRRMIIEQDMLEAIIALPEKMFYNTPISTYLWVVTNKKSPARRGTVQLIDATSMKSGIRKNLGDKNCEISDETRRRILQLYLAYSHADSQFSRVIPNEEFGYWEVSVMHPLLDEHGSPIIETKGKNKGKVKADKKLIDRARVPFSYDGGITGFFETEVKPFSETAWIDESDVRIGYDISFTKYFYNPDELRKTADVIDDLREEHEMSTSLLSDIIRRATADSVGRTIQMQDSGNKWLGQIPAHWELVYLWQVCSEQNTKNKELIENNVLSLSHGNIIRKKDINYGLVPKGYDGYQIVDPGNIILRLTDLQNDQKSLRTGLVRERGIITSAYTCLNTTQNPRFIQLILHVYDINKFFYGLGGGVRQSIGFQDLKTMVIPIPPREEQDKIAEFVDSKCAAVGVVIDEMIARLKNEIALLGQYKTQMAADIITGRTDLDEIESTQLSDTEGDDDGEDEEQEVE